MSTEPAPTTGADSDFVIVDILRRSVDVILLDTTFWGGIRPCIKAAGVCETCQLPIAVPNTRWADPSDAVRPSDPRLAW